jgi:hypothetical protein
MFSELKKNDGESIIMNILFWVIFFILLIALLSLG